MIMMEFARIVTRNNSSRPVGDTKLKKQLIAVLVIYVAAVMLSSWVVKFYEPKVDGRLAKVKEIFSLGQYKLDGARGLAIDEQGYIYVVDSRNNRLVRYSPKGWVSEVISGGNSKGASEIKNATSVATYKEKVYVGSNGNGKVLIYNVKGKLLDVLPHAEDKSNIKRIATLAMTTDQAGNLYVSDGKQHQIIVFDQKGKLKLIFGQEGSQDGQFKYINGIAVDNERQRIFVLDSGNTRIQVFNLQGKFLQDIYPEEDGRSLLVAPRGLAYNAEKNEIYVTDPVLDMVFVINEKGMVVARSGKIGLQYPTGIAVNPQGKTYVSNRETGIITVLNL